MSQGLLRDGAMPPRRAWIAAPRWRRVAALLALVVAGLLVSDRAAPPPDPAEHARSMRRAETRQRFDEAVVMLHARQYEHAATALLRVLALAPRLTEAHVNLGYAWLALQRGDAARASFEQALVLQPAQANAYYGLAMALEQLGELEAALGAMRSYLHLSPADARFHAKARAALWEWEQRLGRHASCNPSAMTCDKHRGER